MSSRIDPRLDHYKTLGVQPGAPADEIKKAYRNLARKYHPDSTGGDKTKEARFKEISEAYDTLGDTEKRAQYDALRAGRSRMGGMPGGFSATYGGDADVDIGDIFAQMFRGAGGDGNVRVHVGGGGPFSDIPFEPAFEARRRGRRSARPAAPAERTVRASDGSTVTQRGGDIYSDLRLPLDKAILGAVAEVPTLEGMSRVKIPPGTSSGVKLRMKGKGAVAEDGTRGDHYVTVHIDVPRHLDEEAKKLLIQLMQRTRR